MTRNFFKKAMMPVIFSGLVLSACSAAETSPAPAIAVDNMVVIPPLPGRDTALGTFTMTIGDKDDVLLSVQSPLSPHVEVHTHVKEGDIMKMRRLDELAVSAGQTVEFKRGGYHLMLFNADIEAGESAAPVTLTFKNAGDVTVTAKISGAKGSTDHSGH